MHTSAPHRPGPGAAAFNPAIQGLRGWAALSVMLVHAQLMPILAGLWPATVPDWLTQVVATGGRGVELFFVISGYLIPASLRRHGSVPRFFAERALRIVPVFAVLTVTVYVAGPLIGYKMFAGLGAGEYAASFAANLLFLAPLLDMPLAQQNAWSLTYEWLFYLWVAAAYCALRARWRRPLLVLLALAAAVTVLRFPSTSYFALGMAFAFAPVPVRAGRAGGLVLGLAALAAVYYCCEYVSVILGLVPAALAFALVLDPGNGLSRLLGWRGLQALGRISYSFYLVHPFVLFGLLLAAKRLGSAAPWSLPAAAGFAAMGLALSVAAAAASHALLEVRLRARLERLLRPRPSPGRAVDGPFPPARLDFGPGATAPSSAGHIAGA